NAILWLFGFEPVDIPWLSEDPISGELLPGECQVVEVTFDSTGMDLGDYFAELVILSNDPEVPQVVIPVTMSVIEMVYGVELLPVEHALSGDPGETVEYTLTLTNTGNVSDTFEVTFEGNLWDVHLPETSFMLEPDESADVIVHVTVPADAMASDFDVVMITATSAGDPELSAASVLTTTANAVYALMLTADEDALTGNPGETVEYTLTLTNTGNAADTFAITFADNLWDVHLPEDEFVLGAGESVALLVHVTITADAEDGDFDIVTVTATSAGDENVSASVMLTTTAEVPAPEMFYLYTPLVVKN
ncbi:MAG: hypothetical protein IBX69_18405, partial [Anaerolineales bacterium]|nr:hypothetical protein [Anaerolineales bacterium]